MTDVTSSLSDSVHLYSHSLPCDWGPWLCITSALINLWMSQAITQSLVSMFPSQSQTDLEYAANWLVSLLQASIVAILGILGIWHTGLNLIDASIPFLIPFGWFNLGYWLYDLVALFHLSTGGSTKVGGLSSYILELPGRLVAFVRWWPGIVFHHLGILVLIYCGILGSGKKGHGDGVIAMGQVMELSSVFVAARSALAKLNMKHSRTYLVVSIAMVVSFFMVRIVLLPSLILLYSQQTRRTVIQGWLSLPVVCQLGTGAFYCLNLYWFMLMVRGSIKVYKRKKD